MLPASVILERVRAPGLNQLQQPRDALVLRAAGLEHDRRGVPLWLNVVVGGCDETAGGIQFARQVAPETLPLELTGARNRQPARPSLTRRRQCGCLPGDVT